MASLRVPKDRIERFAEEYGLSFNEASDQYHAVVKDLAKHPQVPTDEWVEKEIVKRPLVLNSVEIVAQIAVEWQRRCFQEEEPEIPAEIRKLVPPGQMACGEGLKNILYEAYRRGLRKRREP